MVIKPGFLNVDKYFSFSTFELFIFRQLQIIKIHRENLGNSHIFLFLKNQTIV